MTLVARYFGQQNELVKKGEGNPGFENVQTLSKIIIISIYF